MSVFVYGYDWINLVREETVSDEFKMSHDAVKVTLQNLNVQSERRLTGLHISLIFQCSGMPRQGGRLHWQSLGFIMNHSFYCGHLYLNSKASVCRYKRFFSMKQW